MITVNSREDFLIELENLLPVDSIGVELGVLNGDFSRQILDTINPKMLVLIDPYTESESKYGDEMNGMPTAYSTEDDYLNVLKRFDREIKSKSVIVDRRFSYDAVNSYMDKTIDFIYIDASHRHDDVKRDLNDWLLKLKNDSIMAGHDYTEAPDFGVIKAVDEFMNEHNFGMILFNDNGGDWALKRKQ